MSYEGSVISPARLPAATSSATGGVKIGSNISVSSGTISLDSSNITTALGYTPVNQAGDTMTGLLVLSGDPAVALGAATKQYVDAVSQGLDVKQSCRAVATSNITLSGTQTIDGVSVVAGDRVLVTGQTTGSANGIYVVAAGSWTRATDADTATEMNAGMFTFIEEGTSYGDSGWVLTTNNPVTLGTTSLTFSQFSGAGQITAGNGLTKSGSTLSALAADSTISVSGSGLSVGTGSITNTHIGSSAAIAYSKLSLTGSIVNADISAGAAIADTKLATISTAGKVSDSALSSNIPLKGSANSFTGQQSFLNTNYFQAAVSNALNVPALFGNTSNTSGAIVGIDLRLADSSSVPATSARLTSGKVGAWTNGTTSSYTSYLGLNVATNSTTISEVARVTNNIALLINTTTDNGTDKLQVAGSASFTGKVKTPASATGAAGLLVPHGTAPTSPVDGDIWTTTSGLFAQINGSTVQFGTSNASGTVTSVALSLPGIFTVSGSPVTSSGTLSATLASQTANQVFAAPNGSNGTPSFRALAYADLPMRSVRVVTAAGSVTCTSADDVVIVNKTSGAATAVTLPSSPATGLQVNIKDGKGDAGTNNITVSPAAGTIDGASNHVIDQNYGARTFVYNGTEWNLI